MATGTVTTINTTSIDLSSDMTNRLFTSSALTLSADFVELSISWSGIDAGYPTVYLQASVDGTTYTDVLSPEDNYEMPVKRVLKSPSGNARLGVNGLDAVYARVLVFADTATEGTITIKANH